MANRYIKNSVLDDQQFLSILRDYVSFVSPKKSAEKSGVSRQTTRSLYLKFSERLYDMRTQSRKVTDPQKKSILEHIEQAILEEAYQHYVHGIDIEEYRATRAGRMLLPDEYGPYVVGQELKMSWGKLSEKSFRFHFSLIDTTASYRIDWMMLFGVDDVMHPNVARCATEQVYRDLEKSMAAKPLGGRNKS